MPLRLVLKFAFFLNYYKHNKKHVVGNAIQLRVESFVVDSDSQGNFFTKYVCNASYFYTIKKHLTHIRDFYILKLDLRLLEDIVDPKL